MAQQQFTATEVEQRMKNGEQLSTILGVSEPKIEALAALGYNSYQQGQLKDAETFFAGVVALDNNSYIGNAGLGAVAMAQKPPKLDAAYSYLSKAAQLRPQDATIQANLGEVLLRQGKVEEAKPHLEKAFQLDPNFKDRGVNRARALVAGLDLVVKKAEQRQQTMAKAS
ncbi:MAG TPA: tetratricopeptide repeat protein [Candidatus Sulfotelmatobacter sp.]|jgi:tetratricopeptide (TPR) repeat protein|nr:tetratricopeptide repeat protein [Candidatus Sulfotelmatobacter sp.]